MPKLISGDTEIYYEEYGSGYPLLLFAPGGMRSKIEAWRRNPANPDAIPPWMDPTVALADEFRVIAMDQRNAGQSRAPIQATDSWGSYTADHLKLLDHLQIGTCHIMGGCIGASYCAALCEAAPGRVTGAVLQNPIGIAGDNRPAFDEMFQSWAKEIGSRSDVEPEALLGFGRNLFGGNFIFSVSQSAIRRCTIPLLVLPGNDRFHPAEIGLEIASLAPHAELLVDWKGPTFLASTIDRVRMFLRQHRPAK